MKTKKAKKPKKTTKAKKAKKVSVIIPAYNASKTISKVLDSLVRQDYPNYDIFLMDDCPAHPIEKEAEPFKKKFKNLNYIPNKQNLGLSKSINKGIRLSKGEIIVILHDDCVPLSRNWLSQLVAGFIDDGPVVPLHPPNILVHIT